MIIEMVREDIFDAPLTHIVFGVNDLGVNDSGFAGSVSRRFWPELATIGPQPLGTVLTHSSGQRTFHALVCHSLSPDGWADTPRYIAQCLSTLNLPEDCILAAVTIGFGLVGRMGGADTYAILGSFARSKYRVAVFTL